MKTLVLSTIKGNNEVTHINESNNLGYLLEKGNSAFCCNNFMGAYIIEDNKVALVLNDECKWNEPFGIEYESLPVDWKSFTNEVHIEGNNIEIVITSYEDNDNEGENAFISISKDLTIKNLKQAIKLNYKTALKNISIDNVTDNTVLRDCKNIEGSFFNKTTNFDIYF